ncbi:calcium-independent phospholipase A2-gamma-like [Ornithodoros turicata]|uniref:calcium-independent phospholipase A2-gamma-like n=1 Tax=Ornithodoros turicata TaxID=34597 RepID=UPI0031386622
MLIQRSWLIRSNGYRPASNRSKRKWVFHMLHRQSSTQEPYWLSKLYNIKEHQNRKNLVAPAFMLWDNLMNYAELHMRKVSDLIHPKKGTFDLQERQPRLGVQFPEKQEDVEQAAIPKEEKTLEQFAKEQESEVKKILTELEMTQPELPRQARSQSMPERKRAVQMTQSEMDQMARLLLKSVIAATSPSSQLSRLEDMNQHILNYPRSQCILAKERAVSHILRLREYSQEPAVTSMARETLSLLGYSDPPRGRGIRILSIDGGGIRGIMAIEILRQLEMATGKRIFELFDYVAGVSTGAILTLMLGGMHVPLDRCESLYRKFGLEVFTQSSWWGTGRLVWNHAYYDTTTWVEAIKSVFLDISLLETSRQATSPKMGAISVAANQPTLRPFVFRSYNLPPWVESHYYGSCKYKLWQAVRASGAAPGYFEEYEVDGIVHQDGGLMTNNPTAVAIHEAKLLWPNEPIQCVMSIGGGRFIPPPVEAQTSTSLKVKILRVIDSATDTEAVHTTIQDLLPSGTYFRFNPYLSERITLDETRAEKLDQLKQDAQMYLRRNSEKFSAAVTSLLQKRNIVRRMEDWLRLQWAIKW